MVLLKLTESPYNNSRRGNPFYRHSTGYCLGILLSIIALIILKPNLTNWITGQKEPLSNKQTISTPAKTNSDFESCIETLGECFSDISSMTQLISRKNKQIPIGSDSIGYKNIILDGIASCDNWQVTLENINPSNNTQVLINTAKKYVKNQNMALKHLLNYINNRNQSDLDNSNKYFHLANDNIKAYTPELLKSLEKNNYTYELKDGYIHYERKP